MTIACNIDGETRIYAVWGDPVRQVQTPRLINPLFAAAGRNIVAVPFHVRPDQLARSWAAFRQMSNIAGIGVTVPHKIAAAGLCDNMSEAARAVGTASRGPPMARCAARCSTGSASCRVWARRADGWRGQTSC